jgi:hypothetical protein
MIHKIIIAYLQKESKGAVNISQEQALHIVELVKGELINNTPIAKLSRYSANRKSWEFLYTVKVTQEAIDAALSIALKINPVTDCYMWECYNGSGEFEGKIFTIHANTF